MEENLWSDLQRLRPGIRQRWEFLLRAQPTSSPLANPDMLVFLMDWTLDQFAAELRKSESARSRTDRPPRHRCIERRNPCACGLNPLLSYFQTAELAVIETLLPVIDPCHQEVGVRDLRITIAIVAKREIESFCAVCTRRSLSEGVTLPSRPAWPSRQVLPVPVP